MKPHTRILLYRAVSLLTVILVLSASEAVAQRGRWVEHAVPSGSGTRLYECGDKIIIYAFAQSGTCLFYDLDRSQWLEVSLGSSQNFSQVLAEGDVALARSDTLLVAYSAKCGAWDTVRVRGSYLNPAALVSSRLAAAATTEMFYVFDSDDGSWHEWAYTPPSNYTGYGLLRIADDYALLELVQTDGYTAHIVYSYPQHNFNTIGQVPGVVPMDGGYVAVTYDAVAATLVGYCAQTNQYSVEHLDMSLAGGYNYACNVMTGTICGFMWTYPPTPETRLDHFYCYDTKTGGVWNHTTRAWDPQSDGSTTACAGDRYAIFPYSHKVADEVYTISYTIYNGYTNQYITLTDRTLWTPNMTFLYGSRCFLALDSVIVWAYDLTNGEELVDTTNRNWQAFNVESHRDYTAFILQDPLSGPTMSVRAYSSVAHEFSNLDLPATWNSNLAGGHSTLLINPGYDPPVIIFYSGQAGNFEQATFSSGLYPAGAVKDYMATSFVNGEGYLFDAVTGSLMSFPAEFGSAKLGTSAFIHWDASRVAHGYNIGSRQWSTVQMDADGLMTEVVDWIGLVPSYLGATSFGKYYAYNGLYDSWVPLVPEGSYIGQRLGKRTALIVRSTKLYAFDPELTTEVADQELVPLVWRLDQNYPNPFNPATVIRYRVPAVRNVKLAVHDLLGREVAVLVDEKQPPGTYQATFDGTGLASGVYMVRLSAGDFVQTRKMLLIR
jgi:hypothetical protein